MSEKQVKELVEICCNKSGIAHTDNLLAKWLPKINEMLDTYGMTIKKGLDHADNNGSFVYALVNLTQDDPSKMATNYSALELAFMRNCISVIAENEFEASETVIIHHARLMKGEGKDMNIKDAQRCIHAFIEDGWLIETSKGVILSPRLIMELEQYLESEYEQYTAKCQRCEKLVTKGYRCANSDCGSRNGAHYSCFNALSLKCNECGQDFKKSKVPSGERRSIRGG